MKYFISLLLLVTFISCADDDEPIVYQTDDDIIAYLDEKGITDATKTDTGLYYRIDNSGNSKLATEHSKITFSYELSLLDGTVVETKPEGIEITLHEYLLIGLTEGFGIFSEGSEGTLILPPSLAYGSEGTTGIPAGAALVFDIKVLKIIESEGEILQYLEDNELQAERSETGLYYIIEEEGEGDTITETSTVTVAYTGYLIDGTQFDSSDSFGVQFNVENLIPGFSEGLTYFKESGKGKLLIPSELAYGTTGSGSIPANAVLIFDIEVITLH